MKNGRYPILFILLAIILGLALGSIIGITHNRNQKIVWINEIEHPVDTCSVHFDLLITLKNDEEAEFGLRADGIVVWRPVK